MKYFFAIVAIIIVILLSKCVSKSKNKSHNTNKPDTSYKPTQFVENDKIVIVKNEKLDDIQEVIQAFCNMYNQEKYLASIVCF
jgi:hypothetical protein